MKERYIVDKKLTNVDFQEICLSMIYTNNIVGLKNLVEKHLPIPIQELFPPLELISIFARLISVPADAKLKYDNLIKYLLENIDLKNTVYEDGSTLLHIACAYGKTNVVKILLNLEYNPNSIDTADQTPAFNAIQAGSLEIIELLHQKGADFNIQNGTLSSPLHTAALRGHGHIVKYLENNVKKGTKLLSDHKGLTYKHIQKVIKARPDLVIPPPNLKKFYLTEFEEKYYLAIANYFKAHIGSTKDHQLFDEATSLFRKVLNSSQKEVDATTLDSSLFFLSCIFRYSQSLDELKLGYLINKAKELSNPGRLINIYMEACTKYSASGNKHKAIEYAKLALEVCNEHVGSIPIECKADILLKLGVETIIIKPQEGLKYLREAVNLDPSPGVIAHVTLAMIYAAYAFGNEPSLALIEQIPDKELRDLLAIHIKLKSSNKPISEILRELELVHYIVEHDSDQPVEIQLLEHLKLTLRSIDITTGEFIPKYDALITLVAALNEQQNNNEFYKAHLQELTKEMLLSVEEMITKRPTEDVETIATKTLRLYQLSGQWQESFRFMQLVEQLHPLVLSKNPTEFKFHEFLTYIATDQYVEAKEILEIFDKSDKSNVSVALISYMHEMYVYSKASNNQLLDDIEVLKDFHLQKDLLNIIKKLQAKTTEVEPALSHEAQLVEPGAVEISAIDAQDFLSVVETILDNPDILDETYVDPRTIHAYFQQKKLELMRQNFADFDSPNTWVLSGNKGTYKIGGKNMHPLMNDQSCYVTISPKILQKLRDPVLEQQFLNALKKGMATCEKGSNGVKFLGNIYELKIDGDLRLYTSQIFINLDGKRLIVFDHQGNHAAVNKAARENKLQDIYLAKILIQSPAQPNTSKDDEKAEGFDMPYESIVEDMLGNDVVAAATTEVTVETIGVAIG